jgi:hypothetical protein
MMLAAEASTSGVMGVARPTNGRNLSNNSFNGFKVCKLYQ